MSDCAVCGIGGEMVTTFLGERCDVCGTERPCEEEG